MRKALLKSGILTFGLTLIFWIVIWNNTAFIEILTSTLYFVLLYFIFFSVGKKEVADRMRQFIQLNLHRAFIFPTLLIVLHYSYILFHGQNPFQGTSFLLPFLIYFPTLVFVAKADNSEKLNWLDFTTFIFYLLPTTLVDFSPDTNLPFSGGGFDSVYRIIIMLAVVYAFVVVRNLKDVGFYPVFKLKKLGTAIWVWLVFYAFVFAIGYAVHFFRFVGYDAVLSVLLLSIGMSVLKVFLHTAIFEELFFRGLLQNMLTKRIIQNNSWKSFWKWSLAILLTVSLITGYFMKGNMFWFPGLITVFLFGAAYFVEKLNVGKNGTYTALVITSVIFGLVHFHTGSIIFVGLASIGGWAYGYTYIKTKNVFYAALVHALVNSSHLIFGIELLK
jgi:uncharacterized protein